MSSVMPQQVSKLATWETRQVYDISSSCEVDYLRNEAILRDFFPNGKVECTADRLIPMQPRKGEARSYEVLRLSRKIIFEKWNSSQEISALTSQQLWWTCLLYCTCDAKSMFADPLPTTLKNRSKSGRFSHLEVLCHAKPNPYCQKWLRNVLRRIPASELGHLVSLCTLLWTCTLRYNGARLLNSSEILIYSRFSFRTVLRAVTACIFFISHLATCFRTLRFS